MALLLREELQRDRRWLGRVPLSPKRKNATLTVAVGTKWLFWWPQTNRGLGRIPLPSHRHLVHCSSLIYLQYLNFVECPKPWTCKFFEKKSPSFRLSKSASLQTRLERAALLRWIWSTKTSCDLWSSLPLPLHGRDGPGRSEARWQDGRSFFCQHQHVNYKSMIQWCSGKAE